MRKHIDRINIQKLFSIYDYEYIPQEIKNELIVSNMVFAENIDYSDVDLGYQNEQESKFNDLTEEDMKEIFAGLDKLLKDFVCDKPLKKRRYRNREQRCFELSAKTILDNTDWTLVHGKINLPELPNHFYFHAWVMNGNKVYDPVKDLECTWEEYQEQFHAEILKTYSAKQTAELISGTGHYGPWIEQGTIDNFVYAGLSGFIENK